MTHGPMNIKLNTKKRKRNSGNERNTDAMSKANKEKNDIREERLITKSKCCMALRLYWVESPNYCTSNSSALFRLLPS